MGQIAQPSVQSLLVQMQFNGQPLSTGTAFVVQASSGPYLVTNRHNVTGRHQETDAPLSPTGGVPNEIIIVHNRNVQLGQWVPRREPLYEPSGAPRWRDTVGRSSLEPSDLDAAHLRWLDSIISGDHVRCVFVSAGVERLMRACRAFPWLGSSPAASGVLPVLHKGQHCTVYRHLHFSNYGKFQRQMDDEAIAIHRLCR